MRRKTARQFAYDILDPACPCDPAYQQPVNECTKCTETVILKAMAQAFDQGKAVMQSHLQFGTPDSCLTNPYQGASDDGK